MGWFSRKPKTGKQVEAAIKVASNLYLLTVRGGEDAVVDLEFCLPDSRFRYLIFCMSATTAACAKRWASTQSEKLSLRSRRPQVSVRRIAFLTAVV